MKVVVLGGYGNFGARIVRALSGDPSISVVAAGRDPARGTVVDAASPQLAHRLREIGAELVIHTAGPFQGQDYTVARACAEAGSHYIDLADGRRFVCDFARDVDAAFKSAGRIAITGASTVPALSSAVVDSVLAKFDQVTSIEECIAPAQRAPRGVATLAGVLSYCGAPIEVWKEGRWQSLRGWAEPSRVDFAVLKPRRGALCDIPDLELFPSRYPGVRDVMFRAALEVGMTQAVFAVIAKMRERGWIAQPQKLASLLHRSGGLVDWMGTPHGGMVVRIEGERSGKRSLLSWHVTAPDNHGPEIPCMPAILLARKLARGEPIAPGAMPCMGLLSLEEFEPEFAKWQMASEWREEQM